MANTPNSIDPSDGSRSFWLYPANDNRSSVLEQDFLISNGKKYTKMDVYKCELNEVSEVFKKMGFKSSDVAVIVNCGRLELIEELDEINKTKNVKYQFFAATSK